MRLLEWLGQRRRRREQRERLSTWREAESLREASARFHRFLRTDEILRYIRDRPWGGPGPDG